MQNRTDIIGVSFFDRIRQLARSHRLFLLNAGSLICGYVMAGSYVFGGVSPFGVAFCAAAPAHCSVMAAAGAILGYTFSAVSGGHVKYVAAVLMAAAARWLFEAKTPARARLAVSAAIAGFSVAVASAAVLALAEATLYDLVMCVAEVFLVCGATYFFARAMRSVGPQWRSAGRSDISCVIIALSVVLMGLSAVEVLGYSLGRILAVTAVLLCARYGREAGGAVAGVTAGTALALAGGDPGFLLTTFGLGGLVAGLFGGMGRIAAAASYIFVNTITALFLREYADVYTAILEVFAASVLFVAMPQGWAARLTALRQTTAARPDNAVQRAMCERLDDISGALKEISTTTAQVSERLSQMENGGYSVVYTRVAEQVCARCGMRTTCWQFRYAATMEAMSACIKGLKRDGSITRQQIPKQFGDSCCKLEDFVTSLNVNFHEYVSREGVKRKVSKVRGVVTDQFSGMAMMLDEISDELRGMRLHNPQKARRVQEYFEKEGVTARQVVCYADEYDRMCLELRIPNYQAAKLDAPKATADLCALLEADFDAPQLVAREKYTSVQFCERASLTVQTGAYQIAADGSRLCGDAFELIRNKNGKAHFVLSDGMGSGGSAAVDSAMASGLISRLISVGIGYEAALKIVNSALLIKSGEESLATIDICSLDLFTGKATFYKAGAAPTYVVKGGKAGYVESTSLPAGILRGVAFEKSSITLHEGDLVVMVSDGVTVTGTDWVKSELEHIGNSGDLSRMCEQLATTAKLRRTDGREDDITVVAALVCRGA